MKTNSKKIDHWIETARKQKENPEISLTHSDSYLPKLETEAILKLLDPDNNVLEIGCGAGDNSIHYADKCKDYTGVEVIIDFVDLARQKMPEKKIILEDGYEYLLNNDLTQDTIILQRFLINLKDSNTQMNFMERLYERVSTGTKLILCEGFEEELKNLNIFREKIGLEPIEVAPYNNFLDDDFILRIWEIGFQIKTIISFDIYFFVTRLFGEGTQEKAYKLQKGGFPWRSLEVSYSKVVFLEAVK